MARLLLAALCVCLGASHGLGQVSPREQKVRADRAKVEQQGRWIYNDLDDAFRQARASGKPMLVALRCIPCEECVKLDDDLIDADAQVRPLLEQFVCVRVVSTNGLDLSLFQFDTDQSFAMFMLNADKTIYGRFGTRSHRTEWHGDVSLSGLAQALEGALRLHANYPSNAEQLARKRGPAPEFAAPEKYPSLKDRYQSALNYSGDVVCSCIHCHQIGDAQRELHRARGEPLPESLLYPYPHPTTIGLVLDPEQRATVKTVVPHSPAERAGLREGDQLEALDGQPLLSIADVQWVLHGAAADGAALPLTYTRGGNQHHATLELPAGWRRAGNISWRVSTWGLRRMATGGLVLESATDQQRATAGLPAGQTALHVRHVGQFGPHAAAKRAGFQTGDLIVEFDGRADLLTEADLLRHALTERRAGDRVPVVVVRGNERRRFMLPMQP